MAQEELFNKVHQLPKQQSRVRVRRGSGSVVPDTGNTPSRQGWQGPPGCWSWRQWKRTRRMRTEERSFCVEAECFGKRNESSLIRMGGLPGPLGPKTPFSERYWDIQIMSDS